jgi:hypothetical protein
MVCKGEEGVMQMNDCRMIKGWEDFIEVHTPGGAIAVQSSTPTLMGTA